MNAGRFEGRSVLVAGASSGIGRASALAMAAEGADVAVNAFGDDEQLARVGEEIAGLGGRALVLPADVADQPAVEAMVTRVSGEFGRLDHFVSCAYFSKRERMVDANMADFRRTIDVTMWGAFHGLRAAAQQMIRQGTEGSIVLVSSPRAKIAYPASMAYNMAKAAVDQMARTAAIELAPERIRVNVMHPGWIDTPGERKFISETDLQTAAAQLPMGRLGQPEEIAAGILFMLSDDADYMTGSTLAIEGAVTLPWWAG